MTAHSALGAVQADWTRGPAKRMAAVLLLAGSMLGVLGALGSGSTARSPEPRDQLSEAIITPNSGALDLNRASTAELELLPRIGPRLAERIVADRRANGPFRSVDDLDRVPGIGPRTLELIRPHARVADPPR